MRVVGEGGGGGVGGGLAARTMLTSDDLPTLERPTKATSGSGEVGSVSSETPPLTKSTLCTNALMSAWFASASGRTPPAAIASRVPYTPSSRRAFPSARSKRVHVPSSGAAPRAAAASIRATSATASSPSPACSRLSASAGTHVVATASHSVSSPSAAAAATPSAGGGAISSSSARSAVALSRRSRRQSARKSVHAERTSGVADWRCRRKSSSARPSRPIRSSARDTAAYAGASSSGDAVS